MPIGMQEEEGGKALRIVLAGTLVKDDYRPLIAEFTHLAALHGKVRVLLDMTRFHGWDLSALWEEVKFDLKHLKQLDRLAVVGEAHWQHAITSFAKPISPAQIRYFDRAQIGEAERWLNNPLADRRRHAA